MKTSHVVIDWAQIDSPDAFYQMVLPQIRSPGWHGRNLDALSDSLFSGQINGLEPPYIVEMLGVHNIPDHLAAFAKSIVVVWFEAARERAGIEIRIGNTQPT
jgi:RNAse (barnase) inhibitor barstar